MSVLPESSVERRANPRSPLVGTIKVANYKEDLSLDQMLFLVREGGDVSLGGLSYFTETPPTNAKIVAALPGHASPRYMLAHVRHVKRVADARYLVGCQFIGLIG
jgi:PilZ domain